MDGQYTPVPDALTRLGSVRTLAVIGTADPVYALPALAAARQVPGVQWHICPGLDHGLECPGDWAGSVAALPALVGACAAFLAAVD